MARALEGGEPPFSGSYDPADVTFLLKRGRAPRRPPIARQGAADPERRAPLFGDGAARDRAGRRLSGPLPRRSGPQRRAASRRIWSTSPARSRQSGSRIVLASLARAGTPIGVLLRRALGRLGVAAPPLFDQHHPRPRHRRARRFAISPRGTIRATSCSSTAGPARARSPASCGAAWATGGWASRRSWPWSPIRRGQADLAATAEDYLIPSGILNAIVSGLVSRTILNDDLVGPGRLSRLRPLSPAGPARSLARLRRRGRRSGRANWRRARSSAARRTAPPPPIAARQCWPG